MEGIEEIIEQSNNECRKVPGGVDFMFFNLGMIEKIKDVDIANFKRVYTFRNEVDLVYQIVYDTLLCIYDLDNHIWKEV